MNDQQTTLAECRAMVRRFVDEHNWQRFHAPKNLAMALAIEVAELMEHFQWIDGESSRALSGDAGKLADVTDELADVFCYTLALANELDVDLAAALAAKMVKNRQKYPVDQ